MERQKDGNGLETFLEHWSLMVMILGIFVITQVLLFFFNLRGLPWICIFAASMVLLISGAGLILYAKIPVYRSGRFFTFGIKSVPADYAKFYRWGWRVFLFGVALSLCLMLSRQ